jgi:hypothetical protein
MVVTYDTARARKRDTNGRRGDSRKISAEFPAGRAVILPIFFTASSPRKNPHSKRVRQNRIHAPVCFSFWRSVHPTVFIQTFYKTFYDVYTVLP